MNAGAKQTILVLVNEAMKEDCVYYSESEQKHSKHDGKEKALH